MAQTVVPLKHGEVTFVKPYAAGFATTERSIDAVSKYLTPDGKLPANAELNASVYADAAAAVAGPIDSKSGVSPKSGIPGTRMLVAPRD